MGMLSALRRLTERLFCGWASQPTVIGSHSHTSIHALVASNDQSPVASFNGVDSVGLELVSTSECSLPLRNESDLPGCVDQSFGSDFFVVVLAVGSGAHDAMLEILRRWCSHLQPNPQQKHDPKVCFIAVSQSGAVEPLALRPDERQSLPLPVSDFTGVADLVPGVIHVLPFRSRCQLSTIDQVCIAVAESFLSRTVVLVLSGSALEGSIGTKAVQRRRGLVLVQDPSTTRHTSMPILCLPNACAVVTPSSAAVIILNYVATGERPGGPKIDASLSLIAASLQRCHDHDHTMSLGEPPAQRPNSARGTASPNTRSCPPSLRYGRSPVTQGI